jgi:hypothetical protein
MWQDSVASSRGTCKRICISNVGIDASMHNRSLCHYKKQTETDTTSPQNLSIKRESSTKHQNHGSKLIQVQANGGAKYNVTE